jgi:hypothetical protein
MGGFLSSLYHTYFGGKEYKICMVSFARGVFRGPREPACGGYKASALASLASSMLLPAGVGRRGRVQALR